MRALVLAAILLAGCDGLGRGIVGPRPLVDAGADDQCDVTPACRPLRTVDPAALVIPDERLAPPRYADCDADGVEDEMDVCPGVPNEEQLDECAAARFACERLRAGDTNASYEDLRGCRIEEPIEVAPGFSLARADLSCSSFSFVASSAQGMLDLTQARLTNASLTLSSDDAWIVDATRAQLTGTFVRLAGGARLRGRDAVLTDARVVVEPGPAAGTDPSPAVELTAANVEASTFFEAPSAWPGRVRVERSTVRDTTFAVRVLDLVGPMPVQGSTLGAAELLGLDLELTTVRVRADYAAIAGSDLRDVVFATCDDLLITGSTVEDVDVPACEPDRFRIVESDVIGANLAGGFLIQGSYVGASVIGGGATTVGQTVESELDAVTICDLGAAAFRGGELRCVKCEEDAFMYGASVCLAGAHIFERGCPAIELAPECSGP